jgi:hypothetical protein
MLNKELVKRLSIGDPVAFAELRNYPAVLVMQYGLAVKQLQEKQGKGEKSPLDDKAINEAMLKRLKNRGVKERLLKEIEEREKAEAEKLAEGKKFAELINLS